MQIIRDMELVWNMPIHLLPSDLDSQTRSAAIMCRQEWRDRVLPSLAKASHKDAQIFLEMAQEYETEHISAAAQCMDAASQYKQKDFSKIKFKSGEIERQSTDRIDGSLSRSEDQHSVKNKCRCHKKPCTCGAKSPQTLAGPAMDHVEGTSSAKRTRPPADDHAPSNGTLTSIRAERMLDSAEDVLLARDPLLSRQCKDALESLLKHRRSEFFSAPGVNPSF